MTDKPALAERRDREVARNHQRMYGDWVSKVVGVSFTPSYPDNLLVLAGIENTERPKRPDSMPDFNDSIAKHMKQADYERMLAEHAHWERLTVILQRNPDNEFDANAIEVHVPSLGEHGMIGHLTRPITARLAPELDAGVEWSATLESVVIDPQYPDRPGITIRCQRQENNNGK